MGHFLSRIRITRLSLTVGMSNSNIKVITGELLQLYEEKRRSPFPYAGCGKILRETGQRYDGLIPDLDLYLSSIAGYCSWGHGILKWPKEKIEETKERLSRSFFEIYPQYKPLMPMITESATPDLYTDLALHEKMRLKLLDILSRLLDEQR